MKVLFIDIETAPMLLSGHGLFRQYFTVEQILERPYMLSFAAKWQGKKSTIFDAVWTKGGRAGMVAHVHDLLTEADAVVHYNGLRFDGPWLNTEFLLAGLTPPAPFKSVDLMAAVKRRFRFPSNKLAYVSTALGMEGKIAHEGHSLWLKVMAGDKDAQKRMKAYNIQDTVLLEELHRRLLPWIPQLPNLPLINGSDPDAYLCPACGSEHVIRQGYYIARVNRYQRYQCRDCGRWSYSGSSVSKTHLRDVTL